MKLRMRRPTEEGMTLVELLVVLTLLGVIGAMIAATMSRGLVADAQARSRIEALEDLQVSVERISRDVRGASTLYVAESDRLELALLRQGQCVRQEYERDGTNLVVTEQRFESDCSTAITAPASSIFIRSLDPATDVFGFKNQSRLPAVGIGDIAFVEVTFRRDLDTDGRPVQVSTVVGLRNS